MSIKGFAMSPIHASHITAQLENGGDKTSRISPPQLGACADEPADDTPRGRGQEAIFYTIVDSLVESTTPAEQSSLNSHAGNGQGVKINDQHLYYLPSPSFPDHSASTSNPDDPVEGHRHSTHQERGSEGERPARSDHLKATMAMVTLTVLSLILAPGVILGALMKQAELGIALSGAIATVIGIFAGFHYYPKKA